MGLIRKNELINLDGTNNKLIQIPPELILENNVLESIIEKIQICYGVKKIEPFLSANQLWADIEFDNGTILRLSIWKYRDKPKKVTK